MVQISPWNLGMQPMQSDVSFSLQNNPHKFGHENGISLLALPM
jgi:hypothetical protein